MGPRTGLNDVKKRKFLTLLGLKKGTLLKARNTMLAESDIFRT
jgi:hypothetical protein